MATLGTQTISTSYTQLLKTFGSNIVDGTMRAISSGDEAGVSALQICTTGAKSTGTFAVDGASTLLGAVTFGSHLTASTGTATIGTLSVGTESVGTSTTGISTISTATVSTATISTATISTATISTATISTATISTATISTATISTATIPLQLGPVTFGTNVTMSTGTATIGTIASTTINNTGLGTTGTLQVGASGPKLTAVTFATAAYTGGTVLDIDHATTGLNVSTGTLAASGVALGDMVIGNINSIGSTTGATPAGLLQDFRVEAAGVLRFTIFNSTQTTGTIPAGTIFATAMRFTA